MFYMTVIMADDRIRIISAYDNMAKARTKGMLPCSSKVLTSTQQHKLTDLKAQTIKDNHAYLSEHPEVREFTPFYNILFPSEFLKVDNIVLLI